MQQNKFQKINNNSSSIVDVHLISHYILDQIIGSCTILLQEHFIINSTPKYTEFATIMLLNNLIKHYIDVPFEMNVTQDEEPLPSQKDSYSGLIQVDPQKKDIEIICEKDLTRSTKFLRQSSRMKSNSVSVVVTMNRSTYKKQTSKKQSIEVVKLDEPNQQIDEKEQYFRYQHELKCKMLEQIARNEKRLEEDRAKQKNQLEQLKKKQNYANCGYDYDGSILPYNKPFMQAKLYHLQSKILKKKQDKKKQDNKTRVENIYIRNQTKIDVHQMSQQKFEEDLRQSQINKFEPGLVRNMNGFSKVEKLDLLKNDSSLRMTKKQYEETSEIVYTESFVNLHKQHTNIESQFPETKSPIANNIKFKVSSQRDGEIKYQQQNYQFLLTEPDDDREINLQSDIERVKKLKKKEQYQKQNTQQLVSFANEQGKLPALKKSQQNKLNEKIKRSQTQHC
ncbi:unnamed protein product (macronuclear) [Paramecium tetraurelia]|uniref:CCDC81 HU domain-containing protein n=1 Tax=Paramecium tetraurelia TaxID=5888 RepID=A0CGY5_PARTE|nr:uncharacterized protein GSPATT00007492001 [Paramecium tetraurelia]CAK70052.1 unnamed protein product [Paramecium tetraurelia]|eukprot:XP_001437449.1 hypothetical protein (macronuclear) [Paramecium tetraurelia strain d4-2]